MAVKVDDDTRAIMAENLTNSLLRLEAKAALDSDAISAEVLLDDDNNAVGVYAIIEGLGPASDFIAWAEAHGYITPGKGIVDGTGPRDAHSSDLSDPESSSTSAEGL